MESRRRRPKPRRRRAAPGPPSSPTELRIGAHARGPPAARGEVRRRRLGRPVSVLALLERARPPHARASSPPHERVQPPSMTRTLAALLDLGLVTRTEHPADRRQVLVAADRGRRRERARDPPPPRRLARPAAGRPDPGRARRPRPRRRDPEEDRRLVSPTFRSLSIHNYRLWASRRDRLQHRHLDAARRPGLAGPHGPHGQLRHRRRHHHRPAVRAHAAAGARRRRARRPGRPAQAARGDADGARRARASCSACSCSRGVAQLWHVYLLALLLGAVSAVDAPARQAFVSELVPTDGPAQRRRPQQRLVPRRPAHRPRHRRAAHPLVRHRPGVPHQRRELRAPSSPSLTRMRIGELRAAPAPAARRSRVREGLAYVRHRSDIVLTMVIVGMVGTFGLNFQMTTALMARLVFHKGAGEYGLLGSIMAIGSLAGALLAARREHPRLRLVVGADDRVRRLRHGRRADADLRAVRARAHPRRPVLADPHDRARTPPCSCPRSRRCAAASWRSTWRCSWAGRRSARRSSAGSASTFGARWTIVLGGVVALLSTAGAVALWLALHEHVRIRRTPPGGRSRRTTTR